MSYASDKLYREYLIKNMPTIVTKVKAREIVPYLPCLTDHDRETIEAKREMYGNYNSMVLLLDCLKRRENWPEQFIEALEACGHPTMAAEIRREYDARRGINNSSPSSPPTTVIRAHVHPTPSASHLPIPERGGASQAAATAAAAPPAEAATPPGAAAAAAPPAEAAAPPAQAATPPGAAAAAAAAAAPPAEAAAPPAEAAAPPAEAIAPPAEAAAPPAEAAVPPEPAAQASPPLDVTVQPQARVPEAVSPPEPVAEPPQSTQIEVAPAPSTPPPSPETPHTEATTATPPPQREINSHQEPEENSESDIQDISGDNGVTAGNGDVSISSVDTPSCPDPLPTTTTTTTTTTEVRPPQSPSPTQIDSDVTDGSDFLLTTPEKPPVQDTTPPVNIKPAVVLQPEETSEPPATQVVESSPQTETAPATSPLLGAAGIDSSPCDDSDVCLSKPGQLVSIYPQNNGSPAVPAPGPPAEPYSGNSDRLEISEAAPDAVSSAHAPTCSAVSSTTEITVSALPCQENGVALNHNEPEENFYESTGQSLGLQDVRENVVQISEEPSILNLDGQSSTPQAQILNGDAAKEIASAPPISSNAADAVSSSPSSENHHPSEPAAAETPLELKTLQDSKEISPSRALPANTKYILTAAGVGAFALLMAWKFKN